MRHDKTYWLAVGLMLVGGSTFAQNGSKTISEGKPLTRSKIAEKLEEEAKRLPEIEDRLRQTLQKFDEAQASSHEQLRKTIQTRIDQKRALANPDIQGFKIRLQGDQFAKVYGFDFVAADPVLRSQLSLPEGEGLVVVTVTKEGLADQAGIKEKDLIAKINKQPVENVARAHELIAQADDRSVYFDLYRGGEPVHLTLLKPEGATPKVSYWIGVPVDSVDATLRSHLPTLPAEAGLIVTDVVADSPAAKAGVQKNDILIRTGDDLLTSNEVLIERIQKSEGKEIKLDLLRAGKVVTVSVTPSKRDLAEVQAFTDAQNQIKTFTMYGDRTIQLRSSTLYDPKTGDLIRNPHNVNPAEIVITPGFTNRLRPGQRGPMPPLGRPSLPGIDVTNARLEAEMNELTDKIEDLRKTIDSMKNQKPANVTPDN